MTATRGLVCLDPPWARLHPRDHNDARLAGASDTQALRRRHAVVADPRGACEGAGSPFESASHRLRLGQRLCGFIATSTSLPSERKPALRRQDALGAALTALEQAAGPRFNYVEIHLERMDDSASNEARPQVSSDASSANCRGRTVDESICP